MDFTRKLSFLVFVLCFAISLKNQIAETNNNDSFPDANCCPSVSSAEKRFLENHNAEHEWLRYDYYNESCPVAEQIIRSTVRELYESRPDIAPAMLRLVFHDCFPQGCDASVLLDPADGIESEKDAGPNKSLRNLDAIDIIKSKLEEACPGVVSCADIIVLVARESVFEAGGPFYPLYTGRRDSTNSSLEKANELPTPDDDYSKAIQSFASRGFDVRETVTLLGAHSTGTIHCEFFNNRFNDFHRTGKPDPSIDIEFLETLRSNCNSNHLASHSPSLSPSPSSAFRSLSETPVDPGMKMDYEGPRIGFGTLYYRSLLQRRGLLFVDQQLTAREETETWVRAYASDVSLFQRDFGLTMIKLSNLQALTAPIGQGQDFSLNRERWPIPVSSSNCFGSLKAVD